MNANFPSIILGHPVINMLGNKRKAHGRDMHVTWTRARRKNAHDRIWRWYIFWQSLPSFQSKYAYLNIQQRSIPKLYTSTLLPALALVAMTSSGAKKAGVPTWPVMHVIVFKRLECIKRLRPKSQIFALPFSSNKMLSNLISLWTTFHSLIR